MISERTCPHCGSAVPPDRNLCPQCNRPVPVAAPGVLQEGKAPEGPPPAQYPAFQPPDYASQPPPPAAPPYQYSAPPPPTPPRDDTMALVGLIMGILGIVCCGCLGVVSPVGLILSVIAHHRRATSLSLAGIIIGAIGTLLFLLTSVWSLYLTLHPELYEQLMRRMFEEMGLPMPPGLPRPW